MLDLIISTLTGLTETIAAKPAFGVALTLGFFLAAKKLYRRYPSPITHPLLISSAAIIFFLTLLGIDYHTYQQGGQLISFLLGPATVALAIPLYKNSQRISQQLTLIITSVAAGTLTAMLIAVFTVKLLGGTTELILSMVPKSVTTPIAIEISHIVGGVPSLTSVFVVITGLVGAILGPALLSYTGLASPISTGLALGTAAHGIGTGRALQEGEIQGAYSGLAMGLAGLITAFAAPLAVKLFHIIGLF
ncbi:LrgB family protein [Metallumcola ferriviriculae]|uniref:LrgB family protein n=1 Tax=Metallumcola ferriviriculae TaxID=3039180 RepID=A0AAU0UI15_9FIRM|nr:LrgB family protein [Desulfitibacteraceae bacterium MK1]